MERLNETLVEVGNTMGFRAAIELTGLPMLRDVADAEDDLRTERRNLADLEKLILQPYTGAKNAASSNSRGSMADVEELSAAHLFNMNGPGDIRTYLPQVAAESEQSCALVHLPEVSTARIFLPVLADQLGVSQGDFLATFRSAAARRGYCVDLDKPRARAALAAALALAAAPRGLTVGAL